MSKGQTLNKKSREKHYTVCTHTRTYTRARNHTRTNARTNSLSTAHLHTFTQAQNGN